MRTFQEHLDPGAGPKRILSLCGGGVRGLITLGMLEYLEQLYREATGRNDAVLSDHFDLIAGTSTGSILATGISLGWEVSYIKSLYDELCPVLFKPTRRLGVRVPRFDVAPLEDMLDRALGDLRLGSEEVRTGLLICAKRMDTDSAWLLNNNPRGVFYSAAPGQRYMPNGLYKLKDLIRASTAAPSFLQPVEIVISDGSDGFEPEIGVFVDGAISGHNSPALAALEVATLPSYRFGWKTGEDNLSILSLGTGQFRNRQRTRDFLGKTTVTQAIDALKGMVSESQKNTIMIMQALSESKKAYHLNSEINGLEGEIIGGSPLFRFRHVDVNLDNDDLRDGLNLHAMSGRKLDKVRDRIRDMANGRNDNLQHCYQLGKSLCKQISEDDLFL